MQATAVITSSRYFGQTTWILFILASWMQEATNSGKNTRHRQGISHSLLSDTKTIQCQAKTYF